jgi:glycosyltransferase involved in cell wall biosynthesis
VYLIPAPVPIYLDGDRCRVASDWKRALELLRDSLEGRYGPLVVMGPSRPAADSDQVLQGVSLDADHIELVPAFDESVRLRHYWRGAHQQAMARVQARLPRVQVLHGTAEEPFRSFCFSAFMAGVRARTPTVFVQDQDVASVVRALHRHDGIKARFKAEAHAQLQTWHCRQGVARAGVSFLKGRTTMQRYGQGLAHVHQLEDTSYFSHEIVPSSQVQARVRSLLEGSRPLRLVFAGRLVSIKGVDRSLSIVRQAIDRGANLSLDIIGGGPEEANLKAQAQALGLDETRARFWGPMNYGPSLLAQLAQADALLFNPRMEETPRMIFDGYAAGLPLVAGGIDYVQERAASDHAAVVLPRDDDDAAARVLTALDKDRTTLAKLSDAALEAAQHHAADRWYARRAQWTHDMVARHRAQSPA